jgi:nucleotide-binding universal stress UspA family protein
MRRMRVAFDGIEAARRAVGVALELAKALGADIALSSVDDNDRP